MNCLNLKENANDNARSYALVVVQLSDLNLCGVLQTPENCIAGSHTHNFQPFNKFMEK